MDDDFLHIVWSLILYACDISLFRFLSCFHVFKFEAKKEILSKSEEIVNKLWKVNKIVIADSK